jgi:hypothetical protein
VSDPADSVAEVTKADQVEVILEGIVGSTAYGMATADSDEDFLGVWRATNREMLGLNPPTGKSASIVTHEPDDRQLHEVGKFASLALAANPTILELLWLNRWTSLTPAGAVLVEARRKFLSQRVRKTYVGYAIQQVERAKRRGDGSFSSDLRKRTEKHGRHVARLLLSGRHALDTGDVLVLLSEDQVTWCREMGVRAANDLDAFDREVRVLAHEIDTADTKLPKEPNRHAIQEVLWSIRGV